MDDENEKQGSPGQKKQEEKQERRFGWESTKDDLDL